MNHIVLEREQRSLEFFGAPIKKAKGSWREYGSFKLLDNQRPSWVTTHFHPNTPRDVKIGDLTLVLGNGGYRETLELINPVESLRPLVAAGIRQHCGVVGYIVDYHPDVTDLEFDYCIGLLVGQYTNN